jgi:chromate transporter
MTDKAAAERQNSGSSQISTQPLPYRQIFWRFLQFGLMAWGGPVAQIGMLRKELIEREQWLSSAQFNKLLAIFQVLPGPEAHEMCVYFGTLRGGRLGGLLAGLGFMLPGFVLMLVVSWLYFRMDLGSSALAPLFLGMQAAVIALIVRAVHRIGKHVVIDRWLWLIAITSAVVTLAEVSFFVILPAAGLFYVFVHRRQYVTAALLATLAIAAFALSSGGFALSSQEILSTTPDPTAVREPSLLALFLSGLKAGLLTFGGAYTVIPFLRNDAVESGWMTHAQFIDGLALSGILPAPLIIFSTFVGYVAGGPAGAVVMTAGIFLPAFYFGLFLHEHLGWMIENESMHSLLEGVSAGVVGIIAATTVLLAVVVIGRLPALAPGVAIFVVSLILLYVWRIRTNVVFVVLGAAVAGWVLF